VSNKGTGNGREDENRDISFPLHLILLLYSLLPSLVLKCVREITTLGATPRRITTVLHFELL
jgi:hypothetical protein